MNIHKYTIGAALFLLLHQCSIAQTGSWKLSGNNSTGTEKLGTTNGKNLNFITNSTIRMALGSTGNLNIGNLSSPAIVTIFGGKANLSGVPNALLVLENNTNNFVNLLAPAESSTGILFGSGEKEDGAIVYNNPNAKRGMQFNTGGATTRMTLTSAGSLGIGIPAPAARLHVANGSTGITPLSSTIVAEKGGDNFISLLAPTASKSAILFGNGFSNQDGAIVFNNPVTPRGMQFNTSSITRMTITGEGRAGMGTTTPATDFHVVHVDGGSFAGNKNGFRIQNANGHHWTFYVNNSNGEMQLWKDGVDVGFWSPTTGEYIGTIQSFNSKTATAAPDVLPGLMQLTVQTHVPSNNKVQIGLNPRDMEKVFPEAVSAHRTDENGNDHYGISNNAVSAIAVRAIQEQQQTIKAQEQKIVSLEERIARLEAAINANNVTTITTNNTSISKENNTVTLEQNKPNPFNHNTVIHYHLPQGSTGQINVYNSNGMLVKTLSVNAGNEVTISGNDLKSGVYTYALIVNGIMSTTKKMVVIK